MAASRRRAGETGQDFRTLPAGVDLTETIATVDPDPAPLDADEVRNAAQHRALRDD